MRPAPPQIRTEPWNHNPLPQRRIEASATDENQAQQPRRTSLFQRAECTKAARPWSWTAEGYTLRRETSAPAARRQIVSVSGVFAEGKFQGGSGTVQRPHQFGKGLAGPQTERRSVSGNASFSISCSLPTRHYRNIRFRLFRNNGGISKDTA